MRWARTSDGVPRWLVRAARTARSSPRLTAAGNRAVEGVHGRPALVDVATRVLAFSGGVPVLYLRGGAGVAGVEHPERLPVVLVDAVGCPSDALPVLLAEVGDLQARTRGFRPVFLLDVPAFRELRAYDNPMELVIPEREWDFDEPWADYLATRRAMMATRYRPWTAVAAADGRLEAQGRAMLSLLEHYRPWEAGPF